MNRDTTLGIKAKLDRGDSVIYSIQAWIPMANSMSDTADQYMLHIKIYAKIKARELVVVTYYQDIQLIGRVVCQIRD